MTGKRTKKHHFVPKCLQRPFCVSGEHIWYSERDENGRFVRVQDRNIESTFRKKDYYTVLDENDLPSDIVECEFYGKIDNFLGELVPKILESIDSKKAPVFSEQNLKDIRKLIFELVKRTPEYTKDFDDLELGRELVLQMLSHLESTPDPKRFEEYQRINEDETVLRRHGRDIRVRGVIEPSILVEKELEQFVPRFAIIEGAHSFILSSQIAYQIGESGIWNPKCEIWMPISPKVAIILLRDPRQKIALIVRESRNHVREINEFAVRESYCVASHSNKLLNSLNRFGGKLP